MTSENTATEKTVERLRNVRHGLLRLHKVLLDYQSHLRERREGPVSNSYEMLNLVMHDKEFAWLHRLSELVVQIDELLDADDGASEEAARSLLEQSRFLLMPSESGDDFQKEYFAAMQSSPDVVLAHSEVVSMLGKRNSELH